MDEMPEGLRELLRAMGASPTPAKSPEEVAAMYSMSVEEMERAKHNAATFFQESSSKIEIIDKLEKEYGMPRDAAMCAIGCGHFM